MVAIPKWPPDPEPVRVAPVERKTNVEKAYELLDNFTDEQRVELNFWLAEQSLPVADPVRLAFAAYTSLKESELPLFFEKLKGSMSPDLWQLLTED